MEQRLTDIERKIAYQDKLLEELNEVVIELSDRIKHLESRQKALKEQFESGDLVKRPEDETPPPHY